MAGQLLFCGFAWQKRIGMPLLPLQVIADFSQPALMELQKRAASFDVIYVDGDHTAKGVLADALLVWPMVK